LLWLVERILILEGWYSSFDVYASLITCISESSSNEFSAMTARGYFADFSIDNSFFHHEADLYVWWSNSCSFLLDILWDLLTSSYLIMLLFSCDFFSKYLSFKSNFDVAFVWTIFAKFYFLFHVESYFSDKNEIISFWDFYWNNLLFYNSI